MSQFRSVLVGLTLLTGVAITSASIVAAQDTPAADHPAHVHEGTCAELNPSPKEPLENVIQRVPEEGAEETEPLGNLTAATVLYSETEIELSLDDMLASSHAINIHESQENAQNYISCGDIGGIVIADELAVGLREQNDSGYDGVAILASADDKTTVKVYLVQPSQEPVATPAT